jgi:t-SNARE complex subunit (syntaxin)
MSCSPLELSWLATKTTKNLHLPAPKAQIGSKEPDKFTEIERKYRIIKGFHKQEEVDASYDVLGSKR